MAEHIRVLLTEEEVDKRIQEIGEQISKDYAGKQVHLVCVLKGGSFFMCELAKRITVPVSLDFMSVSSYGSDTKSSGVVKIVKDLDQPLIAVVSTASEVCPGHFHLQKVVQSVKNGIWQAGATPLEFSAISQCATQTLGLPGIRYDLPARELIALDIETIMET